MAEDMSLLTDEELNALTLALQPNFLMKQATTDYEQRGRPHCQVALSDLNDRWFSASRDVYSGKKKYRVRDLTDYSAELLLRGLKPLSDPFRELSQLQAPQSQAPRASIIENAKQFLSYLRLH